MRNRRRLASLSQSERPDAKGGRCALETAHDDPGVYPIALWLRGAHHPSRNWGLLPQGPHSPTPRKDGASAANRLQPNRGSPAATAGQLTAAGVVAKSEE